MCIQNLWDFNFIDFEINHFFLSCTGLCFGESFKGRLAFNVKILSQGGLLGVFVGCLIATVISEIVVTDRFTQRTIAYRKRASNMWLIGSRMTSPFGCMQNPNLFCLCYAPLKLMIFLWCCCCILVLRKCLCVALTNLSACGVKAKKFHASWPSVCILTSPVCHIELGILNNYLITFSLRLALYSKRWANFELVSRTSTACRFFN